MADKNIKRLYRSRKERMVAGLCGGVAEFYQQDPTIIRLVWILITVFTGFILGIIAYAIAWVVVPEQPLK
jgi:phage shock protein C